MYRAFVHLTFISSVGGSSFPVHPTGKKWHPTAVLGCALAGGGASRDVIAELLLLVVTKIVGMCYYLLTLHQILPVQLLIVVLLEEVRQV